jgi:hypothetical protein
MSCTHSCANLVVWSNLTQSKFTFLYEKGSSGPEANAVEDEKDEVHCKLSCLSSNLTRADLIFFLVKRDLVAQLNPMRWRRRNWRYTL